MAKNTSDVVKSLNKKPKSKVVEKLQAESYQGKDQSPPMEANFKTPEWAKDAANYVGENVGYAAEKVGEGLSHAADKVGEAFPRDEWTRRNTQQAMLGALPLLAGLAFGGTRGAAIGGQVGLKAIGELKKNDQDAFDRKRDLRKLELEEQKAQQSLGMLEFTLEKGRADFGLKKVGQQIQLDREKRQGIEAKTRLTEAKGARQDKKTQLQYKNVSDLRKEFAKLPAVLNMAKIKDTYKGIQVMPATAAGDMSLIFQYMKMLDPGSTVRESEYKSAADTKGLLNVPEQYKLQYKRLKDGDKLTPRQRASFKSLAASLYSARLETYKETKKKYEGFARKSNIDPKDIFLQNYEPTDHARPKMAQDPKIADWARSNGIPYDKAEKHLRSKGYGE